MSDGHSCIQVTRLNCSSPLTSERQNRADSHRFEPRPLSLSYYLCLWIDLDGMMAVKVCLRRSGEHDTQ